MPAPLPELRLALAMGGGVSLGVFSGSALGEALKLAVLSTTTYKGVAPAFSRIVVDSFSGASAGSLTLGLMFRALCGPLSFDPPATQSWITLEARANALGLGGNRWDRLAHAALHDELGGDFITSLRDNNRECYDDLIAAQRVQHAEEAVWRDCVTIDLLLDGTADSYIGGLLARSAIDRIADRVMAIGNNITFDNRRLLADRVLFACTLGKIVPRMYDARDEFGIDDASRLAMSDGMTTLDHADIRVFDLRFGPEAARTTETELLDPARWVRMRDGAEIAGYVGSLNTPDSWRKLRATAVASGCVPFAFEPVILERKWYELPQRGEATWPDPSAPPQLPHERRVCSYSVCYDGGTFNNEPIREAFRMAGFHDAFAGGLSRESVRRVIFVDPNAFGVDVSKQVSISRRWQHNKEDGASRCTTGDRLLAHAPQLIGALWQQSRIVEGDRIGATRNLFAERKLLRQRMEDMGLSLAASPAALADFALDLQRRLVIMRRSELLPPGGLDITFELARIIREEAANALLPLASLAFAQYPRTRDDWLTAPNPGHWALALLYLQLDITLDLVGKHTESKLIGICPIAPPSPALPAADSPFELPGSELFAFGGFCSFAARAFNANIGRVCARHFISRDVTPDALGRTGIGPTARQLPINWPQNAAEISLTARRDLAGQVHKIRSRALTVAKGISAISESNLIVRKIFSIIADELIDKVITADPPQPEYFSFVIFLPGPGYTISVGGMFNDQKSIIESGGHVLRTFAQRKMNLAGSAWGGPHVTQQNGRSVFVISVPGNGPSLKLELPTTPDAYARWESVTLASDTAVEFAATVTPQGTNTPWKLISPHTPDD